LQLLSARLRDAVPLSCVDHAAHGLFDRGGVVSPDVCVVVSDRVVIWNFAVEQALASKVRWTGLTVRRPEFRFALALLIRVQAGELVVSLQLFGAAFDVLLRRLEQQLSHPADMLRDAAE
jgi:hypothetical protein